MPAHAEIGMKILGPFLSVEDPDVFFCMRGFPDLGSRGPVKAKFYEGDLWKRAGARDWSRTFVTTATVDDKCFKRVTSPT